MDRNKLLYDWKRFIRDYRIGVADFNVVMPQVERAFRSSNASQRRQLIEKWPELEARFIYLESETPRLTEEDVRDLSDEELVARQDIAGFSPGLFNPAEYEIPLMEVILDTLNSADSLLEVGCGAGHRSNYLMKQKRVQRSLGIDLSDLAMAKARWIAEQSGSGAEFTKASCTQLPIQSASIDYAMMVDVLPWVKEWQRSLYEIGRVLRPGGSLLLVYNAKPPRVVINPTDAARVLKEARIEAYPFGISGLNSVFMLGKAA